ncbi:ParA family protein [Agrobacterium tumefaciens]|uniref:Protein ParA n=2 Tax=Agrobacterium tumefaciens TaxID=358 RepID=PARA_AGRTU|nr:ParA family protein [Agrobacterium tumefaciens]P07175.1 RecName: Full=Protein ParA [Agrobacterium tumefaciens]ABL59976.1 ParA [Cosmid vector pHM1]QBF76420.1 partition protein [Cloning vector pH3]QBF76422.1 partition protein [Protein expression vector pH3-flag]QGA70031.1 ParA [Promoter probe vector pHG3]AAF45023.1 partition protein ParA [Agrobacterium tumefaciens]
MPVVVVASSKGGAGKSTTAVVLGTELAHKGVPVTMLDCDPNRSLTIWANAGEVPENITALSDVTESSIVKTIKQHDVDGAVVIVDLEGVASRMVSRAISQADLVLIPMRPKALDATIGAQSLQLIAEEEEAIDRKIAHAVVFTMVSPAIRSHEYTGIKASLIENGVEIIEPPLVERTAYSALFQFGGNLHSMKSKQGNMAAAIENAEAFAMAIFKKLTEALR